MPNGDSHPPGAPLEAEIYQQSAESAEHQLRAARVPSDLALADEEAMVVLWSYNVMFQRLRKVQDCCEQVRKSAEGETCMLNNHHIRIMVAKVR